MSEEIANIENNNNGDANANDDNATEHNTNAMDTINMNDNNDKDANDDNTCTPAEHDTNAMDTVNMNDIVGDTNANDDNATEHNTNAMDTINMNDNNDKDANDDNTCTLTEHDTNAMDTVNISNDINTGNNEHNDQKRTTDITPIIEEPETITFTTRDWLDNPDEPNTTDEHHYIHFRKIIITPTFEPIQPQQEFSNLQQEFSNLGQRSTPFADHMPIHTPQHQTNAQHNKSPSGHTSNSQMKNMALRSITLVLIIIVLTSLLVYCSRALTINVTTMAAIHKQATKT